MHQRTILPIQQTQLTGVRKLRLSSETATETETGVETETGIETGLTMNQ